MWWHKQGKHAQIERIQTADTLNVMRKKVYKKGKQRNKTTKTSRHPRSENLHIHELSVVQRKAPTTKHTNERKMCVELSVAADAREGPKPCIN